MVVVRLWLDEAIEGIGHLTFTYHDRSHRADTRRFLVGRLEVDSDEVSKHTCAKISIFYEIWAFFAVYLIYFGVQKQILNIITYDTKQATENYYCLAW